MTPAVVVAICALFFTVASFWMLNARPGRLKSYEPHSFAAILRGPTRIRLPLVIHNTGALPIIVQSLRLRLASGAELTWITTRSQLKPTSDDNPQFASVFHVPGRTAQQIFVEFGQEDALEVRDYDVQIEVKVGHKNKWTSLVAFTLYTEQANEPAYITYSNDPDNIARK
jgi:hypothetical protein